MSTLEVVQKINHHNVSNNRNNTTNMDLTKDCSFRQEIYNPQSLFPSDYCRFCQPFYNPLNFWFNPEALPIFKQFTITKYQSNNNNHQQLHPLELISINHQFPMAQFITDIYTQCIIKYNWNINDFMEQSKLLSSIPKSTKPWLMIRRHLSKYNKYIMNINPFNPLYHKQDTKQRIIYYMNAVHELLRKRINITFQMDVIFVPEYVERINDRYFNENGIKYNHIYHSKYAYGFDRTVREFIRGYGKPFTRCCLLIMAHSENEENDEMFIYEPLKYNKIPQEICDYTELTWIYNTTKDVLPGFRWQDYDGFCISFHRHRAAERVYISSSRDRTMRVFKHNMLSRVHDEFKDDAFVAFANRYFYDLKLIPSNVCRDGRDEDVDKWPQNDYDYTNNIDREKEMDQETNDELITFKQNISSDTEHKEMDNTYDGGCSVSGNKNDVYLQDFHTNVMALYPDDEAPSLQQIKPLFDRITVNKGKDDRLDTTNKWFQSMSHIIRDLREISDSLLCCLFSRKQEATLTLEHAIAGTFMIRLNPNPNTLKITYKNKVGGIQHFALKRVCDGKYKMNKTKTDCLYNIIMNHNKLKYAYSPHNNIPKTNVFINPKLQTYKLRNSITEHACDGDLPLKIGSESRKTHKSVCLRISIPDQNTPKQSTKPSLISPSSCPPLMDRYCTEVNVIPTSLRRTHGAKYKNKWKDRNAKRWHSVEMDIAYDTISKHNDKCAHYMQQNVMEQSVTEATDIDENEAFEITISDSEEPEPDSPIKCNDSIQSETADSLWDTVYTEDIDDYVTVCPRAGGYDKESGQSINTSNQSDNKGDDDEDKDPNDNNNGSGSNGGGYGSFNGGSGSNDGDDDKKEDDRDNDNKEEKQFEDEDKADSERVRALCLLIMSMGRMDENAIQDYVLSFGKALPCSIDTVKQRLSKIETISMSNNNSEFIIKNQKAKIKPRSPSKNSTLSSYMPSKIKSKYKMSRVFTEETIPQRIAERSYIESVYEFMLKSLVINDNRAVVVDDKKIFNFDLHDKDTKESLYFIATKWRRYQWNIDEILTEKEVTSKYNISWDVLPLGPQIIVDHIEEKKQVQQMINDRKDSIINDTKWTKIPKYTERNNERRMTLSMNKEKFMKCVEEFDADIVLVPIVMFGVNDKYWVEYVWIVSVEDGADIGISFEYKNETVKVVGLHLDKALIYKQHRFLSPSHHCTSFDHFKSQITDIHIGNPDDNLNKIKDLQNQVNKAKNRNHELEDKLNGSCPSLNMLRSLSTETSMDINITSLTLDASKSFGKTLANAYGRIRSVSPITPALSNISNIEEQSPMDIETTELNDVD